MDMNRMMQQAQKAAQEMQRLQEELAQTSVQGSAGGGIVNVTVSGARDIQGISISPEAVDPDDIEMLEDLILAAFQDAMEKAEKLSNEKLGPLTQGLSLPGLF